VAVYRGRSTWTLGVMADRRSRIHGLSAGSLSAVEVGILLDSLCVKLGFCLPPAKKQHLQRDPPGDANTFARAVIAAEGLDPEMIDRRLYRQIRDAIAAAFLKAESSQ
jgi:hypothetical protein